MNLSMAERDRGEVWAILDDHGPLTCNEIRSMMQSIIAACDDDWFAAWDYGRTYNALQGLLREGAVQAAGKGSGQYVLWFIPSMVPA